jgi:hypothetical protein
VRETNKSLLPVVIQLNISDLAPTLARSIDIPARRHFQLQYRY